MRPAESGSASSTRGLPGAVRSAAAMRRSASRSGRVRRSDRGKRSRRALASDASGAMYVRKSQTPQRLPVLRSKVRPASARAPSGEVSRSRSSRNRLRLSLAGVPAARQSPVGPYSRRRSPFSSSTGASGSPSAVATAIAGSGRRISMRNVPSAATGATASVSRPSPGASSRTESAPRPSMRPVSVVRTSPQPQSSAATARISRGAGRKRCMGILF